MQESLSLPRRVTLIAISIVGRSITVKIGIKKKIRKGITLQIFNRAIQILEN